MKTTAAIIIAAATATVASAKGGKYCAKIDPETASGAKGKW